MAYLNKICTRCGVEKPLSEFHKHAECKGGRRNICKPCANAAGREYRMRTKDARRAHYKEYYKSNPEKMRVRRKTYREKYREKINKNKKLIYYELKNKVLKLLRPAGDCCHCLLDDDGVLTIDHVYGGGVQEYKKHSGAQIFRKILKMSEEEAREQYQVLCRNCNWLKYYTGTLEKTDYRKKPKYNELKMNVFKHLRPTLNCGHCLFDEIRVLTIDHVNNDGNEERRKLKGTKIYRKILKMSPEDARREYPVLCSNCNWLRRLE